MAPVISRACSERDLEIILWLAERFSRRSSRRWWRDGAALMGVAASAARPTARLLAAP
jgi:hypothetical protein